MGIFRNMITQHNCLTKMIQIISNVRNNASKRNIINNYQKILSNIIIFRIALDNEMDFAAIMFQKTPHQPM